jgi:hypothetical protein
MASRDQHHTHTVEVKTPVGAESIGAVGAPGYMPQTIPLIGYAFLKVNFDNNLSNVLDLTLPLARRALQDWPERTVETDLLQRRIADTWGMQIPQNVLRFLLGRLRTQKFVTFDSYAKVYRPAIIPSQVADEITKREREATAIYNRVQRAVTTELMREEVKHLSARDVIERFLDSGGLSFIGGTSIVTYDDKDDEIANRVIAKLINVMNPTLTNAIVEDLTALVIGDLLYKAISSISESLAFNDIQRRMDGVDVFLDTGVMFRALGYFGRTRERAALELVDICKATGARLKAFDHNVNEVIDGLLAVAGRLYSPTAYGPIVGYAIEEGLTASDLIEASQRIPDDLGRLGVTIIEPPPIEKEPIHRRK